MAYHSAYDVTVLFGGWADLGSDNDTWEWDGTNWIQQFPTDIPAVRYKHAMTYDSARNVVVLFGGFTAPPRDQTWEY